MDTEISVVSVVIDGPVKRDVASVDMIIQLRSFVRSDGAESLPLSRFEIFIKARCARKELRQSLEEIQSSSLSKKSRGKFSLSCKNKM